METDHAGAVHHVHAESEQSAIQNDLTGIERSGVSPAHPDEAHPDAAHLDANHPDIHLDVSHLDATHAHARPHAGHLNASSPSPHITTTCVGGLEYGAQRRAAIVWSYVAQGANSRVWQVVNRWGYAQSLERLYRSDPELLSMAGKQSATWIERAHHCEREQRTVIRALNRLGAAVMMPGDALWPQEMEALGERAPLALWVRGHPDVLTQILGNRHSRSISIVGSRTASARGVRTATDFAYELASDYVITSGGAFGIDVAAHQGALAAHGFTVIFSAAGIDRVYPVSHTELFERVWAGGGLVISEFGLGMAPHAHRFLLRNRLIAAFSLATVVVEAPIRSGALSTARAALEIGRPVGAVPGPITAPMSAGCHELIRNNGTLVTCTAHIRELAEPIGEQLDIWSGQSASKQGQSELGQRQSESKHIEWEREKISDDGSVPKSEGTIQCAHSTSDFSGDGGVSSSSGGDSVQARAERTHTDAVAAHADTATDFFSPPPSTLRERGTRVLDAVPKNRPASLESIARVAGVSVDHARADLGKLALMGAVVRRRGLWVKQASANAQAGSGKVAQRRQ
ncbi:MAG: DNA-protecting protein DprA [Actinomycetaceae bacterium]|nr:DNA-protecting protein DprA [Arcanobacterium sp.]MDD7686726.1 DNA-protecting protein DprA [Actinomycetaceae bacterium]MDY5272596.1 DNA-processing protein DprA [Arcanobacterium sp.]